MIAPRPIDPDKQQRDAADPRASVWVSASAGSGKTKVLTDRVLNLLLDGTLPQRILCLTFTKAAAAEMSNRVNRELGLWTVAPEDELSAKIADLTGETPDQETLRRARRLFVQVLDAPGGLKIQTIHGFCESLLARFPIESGLSPQTRVMDERSAAELVRAARDAVLVSAERTPILLEALSEVTSHVQEDQFTTLMAEISGDRGRLGRLLERFGGLPGAEAAVFQRLNVSPEATTDAVIAAASAEGAFDRGSLRDAAEALFAATGKVDPENGRAVADWLAADDSERTGMFDAYRSVFLTREDAIRSRLATKSAIVAMPEIEEVMAAEANRLLAAIEVAKAIVSARGTAALIRLGAAVLEAYEAAKTAVARLDYDDLIHSARELLTDREATAWVLFKLDGGLDHVLIDESQDTNPDQWEIVRALTEEFFAGESARPDVVRTVFSVGDNKQSIFSFQRADPSVADEMRHHFRACAGTAGRDWREVDLHVSFRSTAAVLRCVDDVFAGNTARQGVVPGEQKMEHIPYRASAGGRVELWPLVRPDDAQAREPWSLPVDQRPTADPDDRLARVIAARVHDWIGREELPDRGRRVRAGDVMILVRSRRRRRIVDRLVRALKDQRVPVAGVDRLVLTDQIAVMDLIKLGEFLLLPEDDLTLATVLKGPFIGLDDDDLFALAWNRGETHLWRRLVEASNDDPRLTGARDWLGDLLALADYIPPYELFAGVLARPTPTGSSGRQSMLARLGAEAEDPIDEFLNLALSYETMATPSLQRFLHWVSAEETEVKRDLEQSARDEVRVMTAHGAKGLQAPIVILADTTSPPRGGGGNRPRVYWTQEEVPLWSPRRAVECLPVRQARITAETLENEEHNRLLYVAMTRAEDRLYVCGAAGAGDPPPDSWYDLIRSAMERAGTAQDFDFTPLSPEAGWTGTGFVVESPQTEPVVSSEDREPDREFDTGLPCWATTSPPPEPTPPRPLAPFRPSGTEPPTRSPRDGEDGLRFRRGLIVHRLLELLPEVAPEQRRAAAEAFVARPVHGLATDTAAELVEEIMNILETPDFTELFGPGSRAEVGLAGTIELEGASETVVGQVDRIRVSEDEVTVVDYKTLRPVPTDAEGVPTVYLRQMASYRALLQAIWPNRRIRCALLWTDGPILMSLPDGLLDRYSPAS